MFAFVFQKERTPDPSRAFTSDLPCSPDNQSVEIWTSEDGRVPAWEEDGWGTFHLLWLWAPITVEQASVNFVLSYVLYVIILIDRGLQVPWLMLVCFHKLLMFCFELIVVANKLQRESCTCSVPLSRENLVTGKEVLAEAC